MLLTCVQQNSTRFLEQEQGNQLLPVWHLEKTERRSIQTISFVTDVTLSKMLFGVATDERIVTWLSTSVLEDMKVTAITQQHYENNIDQTPRRTQERRSSMLTTAAW